MTKIDYSVREKIIQLWKDQNNISQISKMLDLSRCGVRETIIKFNLTGNVKDRIRSGRPEKMSVRDKRRLVILSKKIQK